MADERGCHLGETQGVHRSRSLVLELGLQLRQALGAPFAAQLESTRFVEDLA